MALDTFSQLRSDFVDPAARMEMQARGRMDNKVWGDNMNARKKTTIAVGAILTGGLSLAVPAIFGIANAVQGRKDRKAYEKQVAATDEAVAEQQKRELAAATNQKKAMARARGIELMYKTGMFDAPKWQS